MIKMKNLSVRLDEDLEKKIAFVSENKKIIDKSAYIRTLLSKSLEHDIIDIVCEKVQNHEITAWKAAELAGISLRTMLRYLYDHKVESIDEKTLKEDIYFARQFNNI
jgi:predicted HTH domain antitoxin